MDERSLAKQSALSGAAHPVLGVLGGMGPAATADFYAKLVRATPAQRDQEHIPVVIVADPRICDRSRAIEQGIDNEVLAGLLRRLRFLERAAVGAVAMPCNTAHKWLPRLQAETDIPFISLVEAAVSEARRREPHASSALVLGTASTISSRIYDAELTQSGFSVVRPSKKQQELVDQVIAQVKAGALSLAASTFQERRELWGSAEVMMLACTELPLAAPNLIETEPRFIDTTAALVRACVAWAFSSDGRAHTQ